MKKTALSLMILFSLNVHSLEIKNEEPYMVKKGDTLWDISAHFLDDPWEWKSIRKINKHISNPDLIYPDDILKIVYKNGKPILEVQNKISKNKKKIFKTKEKRTIVSDAIPSINIQKIKEFNNKIFLTEQEVEEEIIGSFKENKILNYKGDLLYAKLNNREIGQIFNILTYKKKIKSASNNEASIYNIIGTAKIVNKKDGLYVMQIINSILPIKKGHKIISRTETEILNNITPSKPSIDIEGKIIFNKDSINAKKNDIVILNKGYKDNLEAGNIISVNKDERELAINKELYKISGERKGLVFIYKVENNFSYGIIVKSKELIKVGDNFNSPFKEGI